LDSTFDYLRAHAVELGSRILETYPPLQSTKDPIAPAVATLLRKALPAQGLAITGTAKYLRQAKGGPHRRRMRGAQDLYGLGNHPCPDSRVTGHNSRHVRLALFFCVEITMPRGPFLPSDFTATKFSPCLLLRGSCSMPYTEYFEAA